MYREWLSLVAVTLHVHIYATCTYTHCIPLLQSAVRLSSKLSRSSAAIVDPRPVTAEDLDDVLKDLAKFNMGTSRYYIHMHCMDWWNVCKLCHFLTLSAHAQLELL